MSFLARWNAMADDEAATAVLLCCGSRAWASGLVARRPLGTLPELLAASDTAWWSVTATDRMEAFRSHPRIGEREASRQATAKSLRWSEAEQGTAPADIRQQLADGNRAYEAKFGHVFLVRATGRSASEILDILRRRLANSAEAELQEAAEQQREITHLRLGRWLAEHEATA